MPYFKSTLLLAGALIGASSFIFADQAPVLSSLMHEHSAHDHKYTPQKAGWTDASGYQKPGAAVRLTHDYTGWQTAGTAQMIELQLSEAYDQGALKLELSAQDGLILTGGGAHIFDMQGQDSHSVALSVQSMDAGRHYINIFASVSLPDGQHSARSFAVAIESLASGIAAKSLDSIKDVAPAPQIASAQSGGLIIMPAQESIY